MVPHPVVEARARRDAARDRHLYAPWNVSQQFLLFGRLRQVASILKREGKFPSAGDSVLEVGYGQLGWLAVLLGWGLRSADLSGIELDAARARVAQEALPGADLRIGNATELDWPDGHFKLVIASTVFSSILDPEEQQEVARQMVRVTAPDGVILWYDFFRNNPRNPDVAGITRNKIGSLFPSCRPVLESCNLAPPITRIVAPRAWWLASLLESLPILRTHLVGILIPAGPPDNS
ncbi:MAG: class I SAM-dependent methyltransferase [Thermoanaerobaculia bacterium]|nr:class I SAM-dependent methyltransferase [Thermoanaerobaculia bacterium]